MLPYHLIYSRALAAAAAAAAKSLQSCPTLCDPIDGSPPWDSPGKNAGVGYHVILQERLEILNKTTLKWRKLHPKMPGCKTGFL